MKRFNVPVTIVATITVASTDAAAAIREARRYAEAMDNDGHFRDGWNMTSRDEGRPTIDDVVGFDVETIDPAEVEELPARWVVVPQRDYLAWAHREHGEHETDVRECPEAEATSWGVFERDAADVADSVLVEDYPTREQAEAAVAALDAGEDLPEPAWSHDDAEASPLALVADGLVLLDAVTDAEVEEHANRVTVVLADGRVLRVTAEVVGG